VPAVSGQLLGLRAQSRGAKIAAGQKAMGTPCCCRSPED